jgi:hypothetical protein
VAGLVAALDYLTIVLFYLVLQAASTLLLLGSCRDLFETRFPKAQAPDGSEQRTTEPVEKYKGARADRVRGVLIGTARFVLFMLFVSGLLELNIYYRWIKAPGGLEISSFVLDHEAFIAALAIAVFTLLVWCLFMKGWALEARLEPE